MRRAKTKRIALEKAERKAKVAREVACLPTDCLAHTFGFMDVADRLRARLVCMLWDRVGRESRASWAGLIFHVSKARSMDMVAYVDNLLWDVSIHARPPTLKPVALRMLAAMVFEDTILAGNVPLDVNDWGWLRALLDAGRKTIEVVGLGHNALGLPYSHLGGLLELEHLRQLKLPGFLLPSLIPRDKWDEHGLGDQYMRPVRMLGPSDSVFGASMTTNNPFTQLEELSLEGLRDIDFAFLSRWKFPKLRALTISPLDSAMPNMPVIAGNLQFMAEMPDLRRFGIHRFSDHTDWNLCAGAFVHITDLSIRTWKPIWNRLFPSIKRLRIADCPHTNLEMLAMPTGLHRFETEDRAVLRTDCAIPLELMFAIPVAQFEMHSFMTINVECPAQCIIGGPWTRVITTQLYKWRDQHTHHHDVWRFLMDTTTTAREKLREGAFFSGMRIQSALDAAFTFVMTLTRGNRNCTRWRDFEQLDCSELRPQTGLPYARPLLSVWLMMEHEAFEPVSSAI